MLRLLLGLIIIGAVVFAFQAVFHPSSASTSAATTPAPAGATLV